MKWKQDKYTVTDNMEKLDVELIHSFLQHSYWAEGIPKDIMEKSINNSLSFGLFHHDEQIGFGRIITDQATFAYLADVFVIEKYRGRGLGKWLVSCILKHPDVQGLRRWMLATEDAHELYEQFEFASLSEPEYFMEISQPDIYKHKG